MKVVENTNKNNVNNKENTTSRFYHKNYRNNVVSGVKGVKSYVLGVQTHTCPGIFSSKMKVVENTTKYSKLYGKNEVTLLS